MPRNGPGLKLKVNRDILWDALASQGLSQNELAKRVGISAAYMSQLVSGKRSPSVSTARRLQRVLGITSSKILFME